MVPADLLPTISAKTNPHNVWRFTQQAMNAVAYAKRLPHMYVCLVSCFSCSPDASMHHLVRQELAGDMFCYLEVDSHTAHAGIETRVGAFLDIIEEKTGRAFGVPRPTYQAGIREGEKNARN